MKRKNNKIAIVYPPMDNNEGFPHITQNRWFHYTMMKSSKIFPILPASMATILNNNGYDVLFLDSINKGINIKEFYHSLDMFGPDIVIMETKAPVIKYHWGLLGNIKRKNDVKVILVGDHISVFPEESLRNSSADFCIESGDYDVLGFKLIEYINGRGLMPSGIWYKSGEKILSSGKAQFLEDIDKIPYINRELTDWKQYGEAYLYNPCAYIMSGRGCGTVNGCGRCSFCIWQHALWRGTARLRSPRNVAEEIKELVEKYGVNEIFDDNDSGAVWNKEWLREFRKIIKGIKLKKKVYISSNARADCLDEETCKMMKDSGYRLIKIGLESGDGKVLEAIHKDETVEQIISGVKMAKDFGMNVMLTIMMGFPHEREESLRKTYEVAKELLHYKTRFGDALQVSMAIPYPGTPLFEEAVKKGWLLCGREEYEKFDMAHDILKIEKKQCGFWSKKIWGLYYSSGFLWRSLATMQNFSDLKVALRGAYSFVGHRINWPH